jgi:N-acetylmuramoyl-L-alanine amidase CwlA
LKIIDKLLTPNPYSRPQKKLKSVRGVVIHWVANTMSTAEANRNFFENRKAGKTGYGSAHYIIGLKGEIIRCLPEDGMAYHVGSNTYVTAAKEKLSAYPNDCTIGIECCHIDDNGTMTAETYNALVYLATDLLKRHKLNELNLWLHKEVVGWKDCHRFFVNNPHEWAKFKTLVGEKLRPKVAKPTVAHNKTYTVKSGDTVSEIAQAHKMTGAELMKLNPGIKDAGKIKVGQVINVK